MSLAKKAAAGFIWTTAANLGARFITLVSTFILTRFLAPELQGEVNLAVVMVASVGAATTLGVGQFITANPKEGREVAFHGSVLLMCAGLLGVAVCLLTRHQIADWLNVPAMAHYVPGLAFSHILDRMGWMQRSILLRDLRFRTFGFRVAIGELTYAFSSVFFAFLGWGGDAIVAGNIARAGISLLFLVSVTDFRDYLTPHKLRREIMGRILRFGLPITVAGFFNVGATNWDNSFMGYRFGPGTVGVYNQAYRLADLPAATLGDQINDILIPTFARLEDQASRVRGFLRAVGLLALLVFPLAAGLSVVAPTLVEVFYPPSYAGVAPFLIVLASLNMFRAIGNLSGAMLQVVNRTRVFAFIDLLLVVMVLGTMALLAPLGPVASSFGVGIAFTTSVVLLVRSLRPEGITLVATIKSIGRPLLACVPMVAAVIAVRFAMGGQLPGSARLAIEILVGVVTFVGSAFIIAGPIARDFVRLGKSTIQRRRVQNVEDPETGPQ
ncbi:MAG: oligosaccharide flippase family protein, partial [Myxococcales bacterium]|nr:oligosaccharide flippase family protein [Myxococcales bacterium]